jgi:cell division protein FtsL
MSLLDRKVRGFRLIDLVALGLLTALILGVYLAKTMAGHERAEIARVERQIEAEKARIRLLQAEVSHLEQPSRIEQLSSTYLGMKPVRIDRETTTEGLIDVARMQPVAVTVLSAPVAAPAADAAEPAPAADVAADTAEIAR